MRLGHLARLRHLVAAVGVAALGFGLVRELGMAASVGLGVLALDGLLIRAIVGANRAAIRFGLRQARVCEAGRFGRSAAGVLVMAGSILVAIPAVIILAFAGLALAIACVQGQSR